MKSTQNVYAHLNGGSALARISRTLLISLVLVSVAGLSGCATSNPNRNPKDPLEPFNRAVFNFNDAVDKAALKPAATIYQKLVPSFAQTGVGNFFGNLADVWTVVNDVLQGKLENGLTDMMRVAVNSTFGLLGLLDIGSEAGLPKHKEDFGQTLGKWGIGTGPYVVLPLFGPSTLRDSLALSVDLYGDPWSYVTPRNVFWRGSVLRVVDLRASVLDASNLIEGAALDRYEFFRDAHMQRRESRINDGEPRKPKYNKDASNKPAAIVEQISEQKEAAPLAPLAPLEPLAPVAQVSQVQVLENSTVPASSETDAK